MGTSKRTKRTKIISAVSREVIPNKFTSLIKGDVLTKKNCEDVLVLSNHMPLIDKTIYSIIGIDSHRKAVVKPHELYVYGYLPSRVMSEEEIAQLTGEKIVVKRDRCEGSRKNVIHCKIVKGENPMHLRQKDVHLKGRRVVGVKARCPVCGKRCNVQFSRGEYLISKHKSKFSLSKRTRFNHNQQSKRTK